MTDDSDDDNPIFLFFLCLATYFFNGLLKATLCRMFHLSSQFWHSYGGCSWLGRPWMDQDQHFPYFLRFFLLFSFIPFSFLDWISLFGLLISFGWLSICSYFRGWFPFRIWTTCLRRSRLLLRCVVVRVFELLFFGKFVVLQFGLK